MKKPQFKQGDFLYLWNFTETRWIPVYVEKVRKKRKKPYLVSWFVENEACERWVTRALLQKYVPASECRIDIAPKK